MDAFDVTTHRIDFCIDAIPAKEGKVHDVIGVYTRDGFVIFC